MRILPASVLLLLSLGLAACESAVDSHSAQSTLLPVPSQAGQRLQITEEAYFAPSLGFDSIRPIYYPEFFTAEEAPIDDDELILGIVGQGQAKAYPLKVLRFREMVNDELAGLPILVTF